MTRWLALLALLLLPSLAHAQATVVTSCGSTTLSAGTSHFVTVDVNGRSCQSGAGSGTGGGCSQATAYLARATGEVTHAADLTTLICGLVTDGVIDGPLTGATGCGSKLDVLYVLAQQTSADANLNLCGTSYSLSPGLRVQQNAVTFTPYLGYSGFVNGGSTGFNPTTAPSPHYGQASGSMGVWASIANGSLGCEIGAGANIAMLCVNYGGVNYYYLNTVPGTHAGLGAGFYSGELSSTTNAILYYNGANVGNTSGTSAAVYNSNFYIGSAGLAAFVSGQTISEAHVGASLGATLNLALYNRLRTYMTSVGVP